MKGWKGRRRNGKQTVRRLPTWELDEGVPVVRPDRCDVLVSASVGPAGDLVALWSTGQDEAALRSVTTQPGWASFPDPTAARPVAARVSRQAGNIADVTPLTGLTVAHPLVQPLPQGRVLVVGARCRWRADGPDRNAVVYDSDGHVEARATLGDGIEHVFTTTSGEVWVGYFDEGVYGNYGWGDAAPPMGNSGLVRFSPQLEPAWRFPSHVDNEWDAIDDCYALNVTDDAVWTCYYSDFPIVQIRGDSVTGWRNQVTGARALVLSGTRVGLLGGYGPDRDRFVVGELAGQAMRVVGEYRLVLPGGGPLPAHVTVIGRGAVLHVVTADYWYQLSVDGVPGQ
ncbi:hypothetical protein [Micromonospora sp. CB01531]|uniref:hypothetical protein n=1 Tax=Micromonospora sp. CB01531 TaxID=1718947 RepID=UPI00093970A8|nr:hypothetical protein [Micromonospora sp. CB01531]OKI45719.1 hypothetical protein A6A27_37905 [Micromonospora sp. CB01531]